MNGHVDSPEEYFEKNAGLGQSIMSGLSTLGAFGVKNKRWLIPAGIGLGVAGTALGATGISKAMEGARAGDTMGYRIDRSLNSLFDRVKADEEFGSSFASSLGGDSAKSLMGLAKDMAGKGYQTLKDRFGMSLTRQAIFGALKREDPTLAMADNKTLLEAFHTIAKLLPRYPLTKMRCARSSLRLQLQGQAVSISKPSRGLLTQKSQLTRQPCLTPGVKNDENQSRKTLRERSLSPTSKPWVTQNRRCPITRRRTSDSCRVRHPLCSSSTWHQCVLQECRVQRNRQWSCCLG